MKAYGWDSAIQRVARMDLTTQDELKYGLSREMPWVRRSTKEDEDAYCERVSEVAVELAASLDSHCDWADNFPLSDLEDACEIALYAPDPEG